jgi:hypothetical protein
MTLCKGLLLIELFDFEINKFDLFRQLLPCIPDLFAKRAVAFAGMIKYCGGVLKSLWQTGLLENAVGCMARSDFAINWKPNFGERAIPDFMIAFTLAFKMATIFSKDFFDDGCVVSHYWSGF